MEFDVDHLIFNFYRFGNLHCIFNDISYKTAVVAFNSLREEPLMRIKIAYIKIQKRDTVMYAEELTPFVSHLRQCVCGFELV